MTCINMIITHYMKRISNQLIIYKQIEPLQFLHFWVKKQSSQNMNRTESGMKI
jgi:hypothetical protein